MSLYTIADLHLSLESDKPMNIFEGWDNYTQKLEKNWHATVTQNDTVVIIGDISWAMKLEESVKDFSFIESLPGKKILIKGNHDYWWSSKAKIEKFFKLNTFESISLVHNSAEVVGNFAVCGTRGWLTLSQTSQDVKILQRELGRLSVSIESAKKRALEPIVFLHYPPVYDSMVCEPIIEILIRNNIKRCYYGHLHNQTAHNRALNGIYKGIHFRLVSCDFTEFSPVLVT